MAITTKELLISNKSYTNKDFSSIYPEEVDLFKKLTKRYDPETSNESDPFIVNLKTNAFIADKLCYNIDKNVLENYMPSATQETSMRDLCSRLGYEMKYYQASATEIYFKYTGSIFSDYSNADYFNIPRFTEITSQDGTVSFVTITDRQYNKNDEYVTVDALQGVIETLQVADSDVIHLENLNSQNRIYFSESIVAENGVFITSVDDGVEWKKTDNLNLELPNTHCFKFGYDSVNRWPFVEFPADVASLIGSGVKINYIVTQGVDGNVNAGYITTIASQAGFYVFDSSDNYVDDADGKHVTVDTSTDNTELVVKNTSASIGGENPESIDEAYNNFKKTIGTFDTLVTCRDYANAIYNMYNSAGTYPVVSNVQVSDRRDDINYCNKVLSLDEYGTKYIYSNDDITPFDLCLYPLNAITSYTVDNYIESFRAKNNTAYIEQSLEDAKTLSHNYKQIDSDDIYLIKNKYKLNVKLTTTYKVNQYERISILTNVYNALVKNFNAREVDYGEEIPFDTIVNVIKNADERINYVSMAEPLVTPTFYMTNGDEHMITSSDGRDEYLKVMAKNILSGNISLFDFYDSFDFEFNQSEGEIADGLEEIESHALIELDSGDEVSLNENEVVQVIGPSFVTTMSYSYGVKYNYYGAGARTSISANSEYQLGENETLKITYTKSGSSERVTKTYSQNDIIKPIIKPNFNLLKSEDADTYTMIQANEQIDIRELNHTELTGFTYCYWLRNTFRNELFTTSDEVTPTESGEPVYYQVMLQDGEYFFYKTSLNSDFISLGSGTILRISENLKDNDWTAKTISIDDIINKGANAIEWKTYRFSATNSFNIQETTILTLTAGDKIKLTETLESGETTAFPITLDNDLQVLSNNVKIDYVIGDDADSLSQINTSFSGPEYQWRIKSRLDINAGPNLSQVVDGANGHEHNIRFKKHSGAYLPLSGYYGDSSHTGFSFMFNEEQSLVGSSHINTTAVDITTNNITYPLSAYIFKDESEFNAIAHYRGDLGFVNVAVNGTDFDYVDSAQEFDTTLTTPLDKVSLLTIYYVKRDSGSDTPTITVSGESGASIEFYNDSTDTADSSKDLREGINVFKFSAEVSSIEFTSVSGVDGVISIGKLSYLTDDVYNKALGLNLTAGEDAELLQNIESIDTNHQFYYNSVISKDSLIDVDDLASADAFYDYNNIANKFTISEIDISEEGGSVIDVVKTSLL